MKNRNTRDNDRQQNEQRRGFEYAREGRFDDQRGQQERSFGPREPGYYGGEMPPRHDFDRGEGGRFDDEQRYAQGRYGQERYGQERYGQERYGQERFGQEPYGQERYGQERYGQERYGQERYQQGQREYGMGRGEQWSGRGPNEQWSGRFQNDQWAGRGQYEPGRTSGYGFEGGGMGRSYGFEGGMGRGQGGSSWGESGGNVGSLGQQRGGQNVRGRGPRGYKRSDERIHEDLCDRLMQQDEIDASDIEVQVSNGEVVLTGTVESRHMKHMVENLADSIPGVQDVENKIRVKRQGLERGEEKASQPGLAGQTSTKTGQEPKNDVQKHQARHSS